MICRHCQFPCVKFGSNRGKQRWRCTQCGRTQSEGVSGPFAPRQIPEERRQLIRDLRASGMSYREIHKATGHYHRTIVNALGVNRSIPPVKQPINKPGLCDYCHKPVAKTKCKKELDRKTARTKHRFCSSKCYQDYRRSLRAQDQCRRCGIGRYEQANSNFVRGHCKRCYALLRIYKFDAELVDLYEARIALKGVVRESKFKSRIHQRSS